MKISLKPVQPSQRYVIDNLFRYYVYEMSGFLKLSPNSDGQYSFNPAILDPYWEESKNFHIPYFIYAEQDIAGFALVRRYPQQSELWDMGQFFVLRKYASQGIGHKAFKQVCIEHPGYWQIRVLKENHKALCFWKSAVQQFSGGVFTHTQELDIDLEMHFLRFEFKT
ncbi:GNAT family N-acetyltransferase [Celerinatantimonas diazotrophica]|uniref:GNAT family N-acetyltransferase n=1 Tax=Celerinatantimonas diazotrophica TaxID=412034 RepID=UPI001051DC2C|nr:GNAT family N-acetyltransferase [Celerinatantimonas diazotrophica]